MMGHASDGLTPEGVAQCQRLGQALAQSQPWPGHVYSSPLRRAIASLAQLLQPTPWDLPPELLTATAAPAGTYAVAPSLASQPPLSLTISPDLSEFNAGILTGLTWAEARQQYPDLCQALETQSDWVPIPQAESPLQGRDRAARFIRHLLTCHGNGETVWIMSHHWILEHLVACLMGCDRTWQLPIPHTAVFEFWLDRDRWSSTGPLLGISDHWQIKRFADVIQHPQVP
jgi:2,3-bisphosphoglycerate-dependent phosphoglycerate mutase